MSGLAIVADRNIPAVETVFGGLGTVRYVDGRGLSRGDLRGADMLLVRSVTRVNRELLEGSAVRFVGSATAGLDHLDRAYLAEAGIAFASAPGCNANSVVEYVLAAIARVDHMLERLLRGGRVGIVGYGHIGRALAGRLQALGIRHCATDPWLEPGSVVNVATLEEVLGCDVVTLHCGLTDREPWPSRHLLGRRALAQLRGDALLINASRGEVIDTTALTARLGASDGLRLVLDVWEGEPRIDRELLQRTVIGTPHIAGYSLDGKLAATAMLYRAARLALDLPPAGSAPVDPPPPVRFPAGAGPADALRQLLRQRYDIERDDAGLRAASLAVGADAAAAGFDQLRRDYRPRRELAGSRVQGAYSPADAALCRGLGCLVEPSEA